MKQLNCPHFRAIALMWIATLLLSGCFGSWKSVDKWMLHADINPDDYHTLTELAEAGELQAYRVGNYATPVLDVDTDSVLLNIREEDDSVILRLDRAGNEVDRLTFKNSHTAQIIDGLLVSRAGYSSWLVDGDRQIHELEILPSDKAALGKLLQRVNREKLAYRTLWGLIEEQSHLYFVVRDGDQVLAMDLNEIGHWNDAREQIDHDETEWSEELQSRFIEWEIPEATAAYGLEVLTRLDDFHALEKETTGPLDIDIMNQGRDGYHGVEYRSFICGDTRIRIRQEEYFRSFKDWRKVADREPPASPVVFQLIQFFYGTREPKVYYLFPTQGCTLELT